MKPQTATTIRNLISKVQTAIPTFNLRTFNFFDTELKAQLENSFDEKQIKTLKTLQFLIKLLPKKTHSELILEQYKEKTRAKKTSKVTLTKAEQIALNLYNSGLHSVDQISSLSETEFLEKYVDAFKSANERKRAMKIVYKNAKAVKHKTTLDHLAIIPYNDSHYTSSRFNNLKSYLMRLLSEVSGNIVKYINNRVNTRRLE